MVSANGGGRRPVSVLHFHRYRCADWSGLTAMLQDFVAQLAHTPHAAVAAGIQECAVACAGYVRNDAIVNGNLPWPVSIRGIREGLNIQRLVVINDFEAVALAAQFIDPAETRVIIDAPAPAAGPVLVMGPGTGLGSAVLLPLPGQPRAQVLATEAGQISLAPGNEREIEVLRLLLRNRTHVSFEDVLSGPGLLKLYHALSELHDSPVRWLTPAEVTGAALQARDPVAREVLDIFCGLLGSFVGDLALLYGARAIYLAGGILPQVHDFLLASTFAERYFNKGVMRAWLQQVPVRLIEHGQLGVIGAAGWFLDEQHNEREGT